MFKPPAHKATGDMAPGQIVNEIKPVQYLREYIEQKQAGLVGENPQPAKKKLTFEEWYMTKMSSGRAAFYSLHRPELKALWNTAQENK